MPGYEVFGDEERKEVQDVLDSGVLFRYSFEKERMGRWKAYEFEKELCKKLNVGYTHLCSSGTTALDIALASLDIGIGDEVIVPPFTFIATIESVFNIGATPVFAEIDETMSLDPESVKSCITGKTKAILLVHMCGSMAKIDEIKKICDQKEIILIEDACQSIGATFKGKSVGTFGKIGCFSFDPLKTITCGEGGAIVTNDKKLYEIASAYSDHGHDHLGTIRSDDDHHILGTNYRICELNAAVGLAQLKKLYIMLEKNRMYKKMMEEILSECTGISFAEIPDKEGDSATFLTMLMESSEKARNVAKKMVEEKIDSFFYWYDAKWHYIRKWNHVKNLKSIRKLPLELIDKIEDFRNILLPKSDHIIGRTISIQIKLNWNSSEVIERSKKIRKIIDGNI
ncbi:MAG: DegT/DnrJ/EryC1/StrS family aminotransferase [Desulfobacterales bacterium]|nr:DegT/DnrJ/EryC1/StrS family aminotransferase [Desulfobacterales bacterium]MBF0398576.1 DegT/DnrJ/EryC1/StrS family aminotransferase [Desulfobacterales bacterium]